MGQNEAALQRIEQAPIAPIWTEEDKRLIKETVARGTTDSEFKLFLYTAAKYNLDPLVKQVWCVKYDKSPAAIFTGRDGFLSIAHRSGQFDGMQTEAIREEGKLMGAKCTVWRRDMSHPFIVDVPLSEYNSGRSNWAKMPETMIKKVAESQALRRAFDVSGIYAPEEFPEQPVTPSDTKKNIIALEQQNENGDYVPVEPDEPKTPKEEPVQPPEPPAATKHRPRKNTKPPDGETDKELLFGYVTDVAKRHSINTEIAIKSVEQFLMESYGIKTLDEIPQGVWSVIYRNRERLVKKALDLEEAAV
jgi:phage recombination protein Bet